MGIRVEETMRQYCKMRSGCRRHVLLQEFDAESEDIVDN